MSLSLRIVIAIMMSGFLAACAGGADGADDDDVGDAAVDCGGEIGATDGCCPDGAHADTDEDCEPVCGNGAPEAGEDCDDGNLDPGDGCDESCTVEPTAYRVSSLALRDPHMFAFGALDVTDTVNMSMADALVTDDPPDGKLDLSLVLLFRPVDPAAASTRADAVITAACTPPAETTSCSADAQSTVIESTASNGDATCLTPLADTTGNYQPAITTPSGRCFVTDREMVAIEAGGVMLELEDTQVAATYGTTGAPDSLDSGLLAGFMTEAAAMAATIPASTPVVGGQPLSTLLLAQDKDTGPGGESGWWFYFNFTAQMVSYTD